MCEIQRIENGSVVDMYGLSAIDQNLHIRSGSPKLVPGKHTLKIGFPISISNWLGQLVGVGLVLPDWEEQERLAMSNPVTFTISPSKANSRRELGQP